MKIKLRPNANACVLIACALAAAGCQTNKFNQGEAQATSGAPVAARVETLSLSYETNLPTFVVAILPFNAEASGVTSGGGITPSAPSADGSPLGIIGGGLQGGGTQASYSLGSTSPGNIGPGIAAQLRTALIGWRNISIIDPAAVVRQADGTCTCKMQEGELGPFLISGTVTEFNETANMNEKKRGGSLGGVGSMLGIVGGLAGSSGAGYAGAGIAAANPSFQDEKMQRTGMVGIDMQIVDGRTGRVAGGFHSSGQFTTLSAVSGMSLFGIGVVVTLSSPPALSAKPRARQ